MRTVYINEKSELNKRKIKKIAKKINKISKKEDIVVALSKELEKNTELNNQIEEYGIKILDGKWLFKFLICDIVEYISKIEHKNKEIQIIAILIKRQDDIILSQILEIAKQVKGLKIITTSISRFEYLEYKLYEEYGIALHLTNNKKKSLSNVDIIINFDYNEEELSKYNINPFAILVNLQTDIKNFQGVNINNYKIGYNKENFIEFENELDFNNNVIYESYIYRRDTFSNIRKQLNQDEVRLIGLIKNNGEEYIKKVLDKQKILA